jgi:uncharacterized protein YbbC (DUF1343 family)
LNPSDRRTVLGIDALLQDPSPIAGKRVGLITNHAGLTAAGVPSWKALFDLPDVRLVRLFGPEHGVDGGAEYMECRARFTAKPDSRWHRCTVRPRKA